MVFWGSWIGSWCFEGGDLVWLLGGGLRMWGGEGEGKGFLRVWGVYNGLERGMYVFSLE